MAGTKVWTGVSGGAGRAAFSTVCVTVAALVLSSLLLLSSSSSEAGAQSSGEVAVRSTGFGTTYVIEFENSLGGGAAGTNAIGEIRVWLPDVGADGLESFKSSRGWTGTKNSAGVAIFTTETPVEHGGAAKFGLVADGPVTVIGWKVFGVSGNELGIGLSEPEDLKDRPMPPPFRPPPGDGPDGGIAPPPPPPPSTPPQTTGGIFETSVLRIIPDNPKAGDRVRVAGVGFAPDTELELQIGGAGPTGLRTDPGGNFVTTHQIPEGAGADRVNFAVTDSGGGRKEVGINVGEKESRAESKKTVALAVNDVPAGVGRGDPVDITGTAAPSTTITVKIVGPDQNVVTAKPVHSDDGSWAFRAHIARDAAPGAYSAVVDAGGGGTARIQWTVDESRGFEARSITPKYDPGETMVFRATATPKGLVEFMMKNPHGNEIFSDVKQADESGSVEFSFETEQSSQEGTYVITVAHEKQTRTVLVGLGELPKDHIVAKMDKINYKRGEVPVVSIDGPDSAVLSAFVIDQSDVEKFADNHVALGSDGKLTYNLDLTDYSSGVYTLVLSRANTKTSVMFSIGLQVGSGTIEVGTTKNTYKANDPILVLGEAGSNILITIQLIDPNGKVVKEKETFTNKKGTISDGSFRIPSDAGTGIWKIRVTSGGSSESTDLEVPAVIQEGLQVVFEKVEETPAAGKIVNFVVFNARNEVSINITSSEGKQVGEIIRIPTGGDGGSIGKWPVPRDLPFGTYNITATDRVESSSAEFVLEER